jgi:hypothetical protein
LKWGKPRNLGAVIDQQGLPADDASAASDAQQGDGLGLALRELKPVRVVSAADEPVGGHRTDYTGPANITPAPAEAEALGRSADRHDREARFHDRLAAEASGHLYFAFLHAAEAHRAAAQQARALLAATRRDQQTT